MAEFSDDIPEPEAGHVGLPIRMPNLERVGLTEARALLDFVSQTNKRARRLAIKAICDRAILREPWFRFTSSKPGADREARAIEFEEALLRYPDTFMKYSWANTLTELEGALRKDMLRRAGPKRK